MDPADDDYSIFSICLPLLSDAEWDWLENKSCQNGIHVSDLHPLGLDHQGETGAGDGGFEGSRLDPHVPDQSGGSGHLISGQILPEPDNTDEKGGKVVGLVLQGPDHSKENEVGQFRIQDVGTNLLGPKYPGKDGEGENNFPQRLDDIIEHDDQISGQNPEGLDLSLKNGASCWADCLSTVADQVPTEMCVQDKQDPEAQKNLGPLENIQVAEQPPAPVVHTPELRLNSRKCRGRPPKQARSPQLEHAPPVFLAPETSYNLRKRCGRPPKLLELAPVVLVTPGKGHGGPCKLAAPSPQNLPRQRSAQHSKCPQKKGLPEGWITEVKIRKKGKSAGHKDKTYTEISTNKRCRSIPDVWRYIQKKRRLQ